MFDLRPYLPALPSKRADLDELLENWQLAFSDRDMTGERWPRVDLVEDDDAFRVLANVPGMSGDDVSVSVQGDMLTIAGDMPGEPMRSGRRYAHLERHYGSFSRRFRLPHHADANDISATCRHGVLDIRIGKHQQWVARKVAIEGS